MSLYKQYGQGFIQIVQLMDDKFKEKFTEFCVDVRPDIGEIWFFIFVKDQMPVCSDNCPGETKPVSQDDIQRLLDAKLDMKSLLDGVNELLYNGTVTVY